MVGAERSLGTCCRHQARPGRYSFRRDIPEPLCVQCAVLYRPVLSTAVRVALVVGTILTVINQGDVLLRGDITVVVALKIALTYTVPYLVSTYSALSANRLCGGGPVGSPAAGHHR